MSTNLINWVPVVTNNSANTNFAVTIPAAGPVNFYRVVALPVHGPLFGIGIATVTSFNAKANNVTVDSFDSSNTNYSTAGQWDAIKRKAGGNILASSGLVGDVNLGTVDIWGHLYTGPGTTEAADVQIGANGAVGDLPWMEGGNFGIEPGYWIGDFSTIFPDVPAPTFVGSALPSPQTNGPFQSDIVLMGGINYTTAASGAPTNPLVITGGVVNVWVQGPFTVPQLTFTNGGVLNLYVGTATGSGDSLSLGGPGAASQVNTPGYATNLFVWGLPSLTIITLNGNAGFTGGIYAPEAAFSGGGGGNSHTNDTVGAIIVQSVTLKGHWNFHFDENLIATGPHH